MIYKLTRPGKAGSCKVGLAYRKALPARFEAEARTPAGLTGWDLAAVLARMANGGEAATP